jgi:PAS domain S-box-containing protein
MSQESKPTRVLLIEDSPIDSYLIRALLSEVQDADLDLECTDRLSTGLERLDRGGIDVVLLDLVLPDSQGLDTFIKAHRYAPEMPILVLTCLDDETLAVQAVQAGAQDYLFKWEFDGHLMVRAMKYAIERKRAGEELKELMRKIERAKREWESTADSLSELVCLVDVRGHIIRTNRTVETWDLAQAVDVRGREFHELLHPDCTDSSCYLHSFWKRAWEEALRGRPAQCEAYDEVLKRHVLVRVQPSKGWEKGAVAGSTVVVVQDITERKQAEDKFKELLGKIERVKQEWESTADSLPDLICLVDERGHIMRTNRTVETWNLARVVDVRDREFHELLHPGCTDSSCYLHSFWEQAWEKATQGQPAQCEAYDQVLKRYVLVRIQPSKGWGKGAAAGFTVVIVRDITERKRAEEALREYSERLEEMVDERTKELRDAQQRLLRAERLAAIGQLGASVGHELRNPLGIIKNSAYYINMKLQDADEKVKKHLGIIEKEIARSNKIISDLMNFARDKKLALQKTHLNVIVQDALSRTPAPDTVTVIVKLGGDLPPLMADPSQIEQVFINMISNAVQAVTSSSSVDSGGRLEISTKAEDGFVVTEFKDNGCGISEENLGKLFEPLFTTKTKGIGLGLAVSKRIVEAHEGSIEVESEVEKGTVFIVKLPASVNQIPGIKRS